MVLGAVGAAAVWRLHLSRTYAGWEESDYGNLAMIRGVLDGGFLHYDMNHMPGYYALSAMALAVVGDAGLAGRIVTLGGGLATVALAVALADRLAGPRAALVAGALLVLQPELALYSSSTLREPLYAAWVLAALTALHRGAPLTAGAFAALAFSVRFDALFVMGALFGLDAAGDRAPLRRAARTLSPLLGAAALWSAYCRVEHGTFWFFSHSVQVNLDTGLGAEAEAPGAWLANGLRVAAQLGAWLLPWRIGWVVWGGLVLALIAGPWTRAGPARTTLGAAALLTGFWLAVGFTGQHDPGHNLYWKWMTPLVPVVIPVGVTALERLAVRLGPRLGAALMLLAVVQAVPSYLRETKRQWQLSQDLYAPQRELGRWVEQAVPEDVPLLFDNIPACWINRRPHARQMTSWFDVPSAPGDASAFGAWLDAGRVGWVLWFREDWTQAPRVAPALAAGGEIQLGAVRIAERAREDGYGWILYEVIDPPDRSAGAGALPPCVVAGGPCQPEADWLRGRGLPGG